jgi:hypothetical protein
VRHDCSQVAPVLCRYQIVMGRLCSSVRVPPLLAGVVLCLILLSQRSASSQVVDDTWDPYEYPLEPLQATPQEGPEPTPAVAPTTTESLGTGGLMLEAGVPDGATASLVWRPLPWLRLHGGGGTNSASLGIRGGATLVPFEVGPSLVLSGGRYFEGDATQAVNTISGGATTTPAVLQHFGYDFVTAQAGVEFGRDNFTLYLHAGVSWIHSTLHNVDGLFVPQDPNQPALTTVNVTRDPTLSAIMPSLSVGMVAYIL